MGKHLKHGKSILGSGKNDHNPGCIAGMLHVLDYHHWRKKQQRNHRPICWRTPRTHSLEHETDEQQPFLDPKKGNSKMLTVVEKSKRETDMKKKISKDFSQEQFKECVDIVEILNVNKEIFVKILKEPDLGFGKQFHIRQTPKRLAKSGSFPLFGSSRALPLRPISTLEHKQIEYWHAPKEGSLVLTLDVPRSGSAEFREDQRSITGSSLEQKPSFSSHGISGGSGDHGFNHVVMHGFREIKKWLRKALADRKNKKKHSPTSFHKMGVSENDMRSKELHPMKHTSSLNDSLGRYSQLFDQSFRREIKFNSKSLKLINEDDKSVPRGNQPKFFRRISSLSSLESFGSFLTELYRDGTASSNLENRISMDHDITIGTDKSTFQKNIVHEMESRKNIDLQERQVASESPKDIPIAIDFPESVIRSKEEEEEEEEEEKEERSSEDHRESNSGSQILQQSPVSVPEASSSEKTERKAETLFSEGSDPTSSEIPINILDSSLKLQSKSDCHAHPQELSTKHKIYEHCQRYNPEEEEDDPYFCYLKNILELSGFLTNKNLSKKWHSEDQPINPSLLCKFNPHMHEELNHDKLLFDLVNGAVSETYNQSNIYFPKAFSFTRRVYPPPTGKHLLDEVWGRIQWSLVGLWDNKEDCSLDDLVARDLAKADGWMNVQVEAEWLALELEDLILDEILDELV